MFGVEHMLTVALLSFVLAALLGVTLLIFVLKNKARPIRLIHAHGLFAALGLILLIIYGIKYMDQRILIACVVFVIVAIVGFFMGQRDTKGLKVPKWLAIVHGSIGALTFLYVIAVVVSRL